MGWPVNLFFPRPKADVSEDVPERAPEAKPGEEHDWWHADGITRHLVCLACGLGMHDIEPSEHVHKAGFDMRECLIAQHRA